jgi:hypothetical protein
MPEPRRRRARPQIERLDAIALSSGLLPPQGLVDPRSTAIVADLRDDLLRSTPHDGR